MKKIILLMLVMTVAMMNFVSAADVDTFDTTCYPTLDSYQVMVELGETIWPHIKLSSLTDLKDVEVKVSFSGNEYEKVEKKSGLFDMDANTIYHKSFSLIIPTNMDPGQYQLRFQITDKNSLSKTCYANYNIKPKRNLVEIKDNAVQQSTTVDAGGFLQVKSLVKNTGQKEQDWMKVTLAVDTLGISDSKYFTNVKAEKSVEFDGLLKIPNTATTDNYFAKLTVTYYDGDSTVAKTIPFTVQGKTTTVAAVSSTATTQVLPATTTTTSTTTGTASLLKTVLPVVLIVLVLLAIITGAIVLFRR